MTTTVRSQPGFGRRHVAYRPAITDGLRFWHVFGHSYEESRVNRALPNPREGKAEVIGAPTILPSWLTFHAVDETKKAIRSPLKGSPQFTRIGIIFVPTTVTANNLPPFISTNTGTGAQLGEMMYANTVPGSITAFVGVTDGSTWSSVSTSLTGGSAADPSNWRVIAETCSADRIRLFDLSEGEASVATVFPSGAAHVPSSGPITFGDTAEAENAVYDGISSQAQWKGWNRVLSGEEMLTAAAQMVKVSRGYGLDVPTTLQLAA